MNTKFTSGKWATKISRNTETETGEIIILNEPRTYAGIGNRINIPRTLYREMFYGKSSGRKSPIRGILAPVFINYLLDPLPLGLLCKNRGRKSPIRGNLARVLNGYFNAAMGNRTNIPRIH